MTSIPLPEGLPVPVDDGACDHLADTVLPSIPLSVAKDSSQKVDPSQLRGRTVLFFYPATGVPGKKVPEEWDAIPGARGCTPQMCVFRDTLPKLRDAGVDNIFGVSTQAVDEQKEAHERLELPYDLLHDGDSEFVRGLSLPTLDWEGTKLVKRLSLIIEDGKIVKCHYPVFPSDKNVEMVLEYLKNR